MSIEKVCKIIKKNKSFLISAHYDPEGDSLGSQLGMAEILRQLGKKYLIVNPDIPPRKYEFLKGVNDIVLPSAKIYNFDIALVLDCPIIERIGRVIDMIGDRPIVNIDHHISNKNFGAVNYVLPKASSTGEIIYTLARKLGCKINKDLATYLYLSILTDTGGFRYSNTTPETMKIIADLSRYGINPKEIYERIYEAHSLASRKLLGLSLGTLKVSGDGKIAWMHLTEAMFDKVKAKPDDAENFVNYARFIEGVKIAALFSSNAKKGFTKVSFRSNEKWADVNKIASKFGGGGHHSASGCEVKGDIRAVEKKVLTQIRKYIANSK